VTRAALAFAVVVGAARAEPVSPADALPPCPIDAAALDRLRSEHSAMNAAGLACLAALDAARAERDQVALAATQALDDLARELAASAAALDAAQAALAAPAPEPAQGRPWAFILIGGTVAAGGALGAHVADLDTPGRVSAVAGVVAAAALISAAISWAGAQ
jgi:hypothetical protein